MRPVPKLAGKGLKAIVKTSKPKGIASRSMWPSGSKQWVKSIAL